MNTKIYSQIFPNYHQGKKFSRELTERRNQHLKSLDSFLVLSGIPHEPGSENLWIMNGLRIFQEPAMMYLTGINQPGLILALLPKAKNPCILFLPEKNPKKEFWDGVRFGYVSDKSAKAQPDLPIIKQLTGIDKILPVTDFENYFEQWVQKEKKHAYVFYHHYPSKEPTLPNQFLTTTDHNYTFYTRCKSLLPSKSSVVLKSFAEEHYRLRLPLSRSQIQDVLKANLLTGKALQSTCKKISECTTEHDVRCLIEYHLQKLSVSGLSFPSIVASGANAATLHYLKNDDPLVRDKMLLIDFGVRVGTMHADISRTLPLSGKFNPLQALLYQIVLDTQIYAESLVKPGITLREVNELVWPFLESLLATRFTAQGGKMKRDYTGRPHGLSHLMGEQEHDGDPHRLYQDQPLQVGWQISNEPGLYGFFEIKIKGKLYREKLGIRIEDNLILTPKGNLNASKGIPKTISEIEKLMASRKP